MGTDQKTVNNSNQPAIVEQPDSAPEGRWARAWILTKVGRFRVHFSVIGPESEQFQGNLPLSGAQAEHILEAVADLVKSFKQKPRRKHSGSG